jgi:ABC-2 type transport system permease protein
VTISAAGPTERTQRSPVGRYRHSLWLLTKRDLHVRYATNALGYLWSILDPLLMAGIYFLVFTVIFQRGGVTEDPYIVFLLSGMLPWTWFNGAVSDFTRAYSRDAKLIRSVAIPRTIWINRIVLSKGIEYLFSLPVLVLFIVVNLVVELDPNQTVHIGWGILWSDCSASTTRRSSPMICIGIWCSPRRSAA